MAVKNNLSLDHKIVLPNTLIKNYVETLNLRQMKEFRLIVSCIDTNNPSKIIYLSKKVLWDYFAKENPSACLSDKYKYMTLQYDFETLQSLTAKKINQDGEIGFGHLITWTSWSIKDDKDLIKVTLNEEVLPEFCQLKNTLRYQPLDIVGFSSKYTLLLYELLMAEKWKNTGSLVVSIDYWKQKTLTANKYSRFEAWYRKVIKIAIDEINKKTNYQVECVKLPPERTKEKTDLQFSIREKYSENIIDAQPVPNNFVYDRWEIWYEQYKDIPYGHQAINRVRKSYEFYLQTNEQEILIGNEKRDTKRLKDSLQRCKPQQIETIIKYLIEKKCVVTNKQLCKMFWEMNRNEMYPKYRNAA